MVLAASLATNSRALWYLTRGFGLVALILLSLTVVLGLSEAVRFARPGWPRFVLAALHKNAALLAVAAVAVHVVTSILDSYAPIHVADVFLPFVSAYRPVWIGFGALAVDLMLALVITSLLRERLGYTAWRVIHWTAFVCWPIAVIHGLGTGSDTKLGWVQIIYVICVAAVLCSLWWRLARGWTVDTGGRRGMAVLASIVLPVAITVWTVTGPLRPGWARKSGTPAALLGTSAATASPSTTTWSVPTEVRFDGTWQQSGANGSGPVTVTIAATIPGAAPGQLRIVLTGQPAAGGGVELARSQVTLGPSSSPTEYQGQVTQLQGSTLVAGLNNGAGRALTITAEVQVDEAAGTVTGTMEART